MGVQLTPLFQAVEAAARKRPTEERVAKGVALCRLAYRHAQEIQALCKLRRQQQHDFERIGARNGAVALLDAHPVEIEAMRYLCPDFGRGDPSKQKRGLKWLKKQDYMKEFLPPAYKKVRY